jgi:hypothetical protein
MLAENDRLIWDLAQREVQVGKLSKALNDQSELRQAYETQVDTMQMLISTQDQVLAGYKVTLDLNQKSVRKLKRKNTLLAGALGVITTGALILLTTK